MLNLFGKEDYGCIRQSRAWDLIEAELQPIIDVDEMHHRVEYFLRANLKFLLLFLGYKSANGCDVYVFIPQLREEVGWDEGIALRR